MLAQRRGAPNEPPVRGPPEGLDLVERQVAAPVEFLGIRASFVRLTAIQEVGAVLEPFRTGVARLVTMTGMGDVAAQVLVSEFGVDGHLRPERRAQTCTRNEQGAYEPCMILSDIHAGCP